MSCQIIYDEKLKIGCFYCSTMDVAFGPVFYSNVETTIQEFQQSLNEDARKYDYEELADLWQEFKKENKT